jgi:hypothetical protein
LGNLGRNMFQQWQNVETSWSSVSLRD